VTTADLFSVSSHCADRGAWGAREGQRGSRGGGHASRKARKRDGGPALYGGRSRARRVGDRAHLVGDGLEDLVSVDLGVRDRLDGHGALDRELRGAGEGETGRQKEGYDSVTTDGAVRQSRASRARDASTNAAFAPKRRGDVLPNRSGRPRATGRAASRARVRIRRAEVTATGPPGLNIAGVFFRERRQRSGLTLGCATFTPLKVVARRERAARALGAAARGARIATGATMAAMITAVLLDVIHIRRFPELFPRRIFCRAQPLPKNKIRDCSPIRSRQRTHAVRRESALRLVRQSQNLPTRLASCHQPERGRADRRAFWQSPIRLDSSIYSVGRTRRPATALLPDGSPSRFPDALARVVVCLRRARSMVSDGRSRVRGPVDVGVEG